MKDDLISRQAAIDARRYTFGNDEFSLEAAYHDCKLVFDGITGDDSFQEADTGLILYYANEIIYALQEALEGKDTNVPTNDHISRQAAIEALCHIDEYNAKSVSAIKALPSAQPEHERVSAEDVAVSIAPTKLASAVWLYGTLTELEKAGYVICRKMT